MLHRNQKGFAPIVTLLVVVALVVVGFVYFKNRKLVTNSTGLTTQNPSTPKQSVLDGLKSALSIKTDKIEDSTYEWMITYKKLVPLVGQSFTDSGFKDKGSKDSVEPILNSYFTNLGFVKDHTNTLNTLDSGSNLAQQSYGFTKDDTKCIAIFYLDPYSDVTWLFFCGKIDDNAEKLREEFTAVFDAKDANDPKAVILGADTAKVITVKKVLGNFANGRDDEYLKGVYLPSGGFWVAVKTNGRWQIIHDGQDHNQCSVFDKYNVPKEIYGNCYLNLKDSTLRFQNSKNLN